MSLPSAVLPTGGGGGASSRPPSPPTASSSTTSLGGTAIHTLVKAVVVFVATFVIVTFAAETFAPLLFSHYRKPSIRLTPDESTKSDEAGAGESKQRGSTPDDIGGVGSNGHEDQQNRADIKVSSGEASSPSSLRARKRHLSAPPVGNDRDGAAIRVDDLDRRLAAASPVSPQRVSFEGGEGPTASLHPELRRLRSLGVPLNAVKEFVDDSCRPVGATKSKRSTLLAPSLSSLQLPRSGGGEEEVEKVEKDHQLRRSYLQSVPCPQFTPMAVDEDEDNRTKNIDHRRSWIIYKYNLYSSRCRKREGMMWKELTRETHNRILNRVVSVTNVTRDSLVLDWGCGCGVTMAQLATTITAGAASVVDPPGFFGLGIDLTEAAVNVSREDHKHLSRHTRFCHADGTDLSWLRTNSVDAVIAFGALAHVPLRHMCRTINHLMRVLRPGGIAWAGYIDNRETLGKMMSCPVVVACDHGQRVAVTAVTEFIWFAADGMPKGNRKRRPRSIIWRKY